METSPQTVRIASLQYYIRPVETWEQFADQVTGLVATAADYKCRLCVFPEYFCIQLLTLGDLSQPITDQIRALAHKRHRIVELLAHLAAEYKIYIVGGSMPAVDAGDDAVYNDCYVFNPQGHYSVQGKMHMTRWECDEWLLSARKKLRVFDTDFGKIAVTICYDVEFPELARAAARQGAMILVAPSCTDDRHGFLRVRYCAQARAIENQMYVVHSCTVGSLPMVPAVSLNFGQASILTPSDFPFARDGILAEGVPNQESMVIGDVDLDIIRRSREEGTVLPLTDSQTTAQVASSLEVVTL